MPKRKRPEDEYIPTIRGLNPVLGPKTGLAGISLMGTGFVAGGTVVYIDGIAINPVLVTPTTITFDAPPHASGTVTVRVVTPSGASANVPGGFTYIDNPSRLPITGRRDTSFLIAETKAMDRARREAEQQGERNLASVKARDHSNDEQTQPGPEGELQNSILQHPYLDSQRFDGVDPNLNPEPPLNTEARREYDNEKREQEKEKQLRLGNMPKFNTAPTPKGP